jgi:hypothetical protein
MPLRECHKMDERLRFTAQRGDEDRGVRGPDGPKVLLSTG